MHKIPRSIRLHENYFPGAFVGPVAAGVLMDWCGLRWATQFITALCAVHIFLLLAYAVVTTYFRTRYDRNGYEEIGGADDDDYYRNGDASAASDYGSSSNGSSSVHIPAGETAVPGITVSSAPAMSARRRPRTSVVAHNRLSHPRSPAGLFGGVHGFAYINSPDAAVLTTAHSHHYIAGTSDVPITSSHLEIPHEFHALPHEVLYLKVTNYS